MNDLQRLAAKLLCCGFQPDRRADFDSLLDLGLAGAILFSRNATTFAEVTELTKDLRQRNASLYIGVDQEGGRVQRFTDGFSVVPPMRECGTPGKAAEAGMTLGLELRQAGINLNFAPVADVDSNPANPVIGDRSFGDDPHVVAECVIAHAAAMQSAGVAACMKHFPGHGDTSQDSHHDLPRLPHDLERLNAVELVPFAKAADVVASCMTAHVIFEPLDDKPATMSSKVLDLLRNQLGFRGVLFTDDLEMDAVADHYELRQIIRDGLAASVDVFLVCHDPAKQRAALEELVAAVVDGVVDQSRLEQSAARVEAMATRFAF